MNAILNNFAPLIGIACFMGLLAHDWITGLLVIGMLWANNWTRMDVFSTWEPTIGSLDTRESDREWD